MNWGFILRGASWVLNTTGIATMAFQLGNFFNDDPSDDDVQEYVRNNPEKAKYALQQPTLTKFGIIMIPIFMLAVGYLVLAFKRKK